MVEENRRWRGEVEREGETQRRGKRDRRLRIVVLD